MGRRKSHAFDSEKVGRYSIMRESWQVYKCSRPRFVVCPQNTKENVYFINLN